MAGVFLELPRFIFMSLIIRNVFPVFGSGSEGMAFIGLLYPQLFCVPLFYFLWQDNRPETRCRQMVAFIKITGIIAFLPFIISYISSSWANILFVKFAFFYLIFLVLLFLYDVFFAAISLVPDDEMDESMELEGYKKQNDEISEEGR